MKRERSEDLKELVANVLQLFTDVDCDNMTNWQYDELFRILEDLREWLEDVSAGDLDK